MTVGKGRAGDAALVAGTVESVVAVVHRIADKEQWVPRKPAANMVVGRTADKPVAAVAAVAAVGIPVSIAVVEQIGSRGLAVVRRQTDCIEGRSCWNLMALLWRAVL